MFEKQIYCFSDKISAKITTFEEILRSAQNDNVSLCCHPEERSDEGSNNKRRFYELRIDMDYHYYGDGTELRGPSQTQQQV